MNPQICVSLSPPDTTELLSNVRRAEQLTADLVEVRLDKLRNYNGLAKAAKVAGKPLIATNRPLSEKGSFGGSETQRLKILSEAIDGGFSYVDLEFKTPSIEDTIKSFREKGAKIIISHHDYFRTPRESKLDSTLAQLRRYRPDVCKIVTTANHLDDNLTVLNLVRTKHQKTPLVSFAMGKRGVWSRLLAPLYGAHFTYASLHRGQETAPGQTPIKVLRQIYGILDVA